MASTTASRPSAFGLRSVRLLEGLPTSALEEIAQQCRWRHVPGGTRIITRETPDQDVYLVVSGKVRITAYSVGGRQVTFRDVAAGDWFGDLAALDGYPRSADVDALEATLVASMNPPLFRRILHKYPEVCDRVLQRLVVLVRGLTERLFDVSTLGVQHRVHAELLRLAREAGIQANTACLCPAPKHADIASKVSTYREQVTRELSAMVKQGLLERRDGALVIPDVARLEKLLAETRRMA
jgi:CRP/FNR family transcriptional regulator, cyclic AMP receptor protein